MPLSLKIFNKYLEKPEDTPMKNDRVQRLPKPNQTSITKGRDIICRIHVYRDRQMLMQKAWGKGPLHLEGMMITLWQDISKPTLLIGNKLKPLLELIRTKGGNIVGFTTFNCLFIWTSPLLTFY